MPEIITSSGQHFNLDVGSMEKAQSAFKTLGVKGAPPALEFKAPLQSLTPWEALVDHVTKSIIGNPYAQGNVSLNYADKPIMADFGKGPQPMYRGNFAEHISPSGSPDLILYRPDGHGGDMMGSRAVFTYPDSHRGRMYLGSHGDYFQRKIWAQQAHAESVNSQLALLDEELGKVGFHPGGGEVNLIPGDPIDDARFKRFMEVSRWKGGLEFQKQFLEGQAAANQEYLDRVIRPAEERGPLIRKMIVKENPSLFRYLVGLRNDVVNQISEPVLDQHLTPSALAGEAPPRGVTEVINIDDVREDVKGRMRKNPSAVELNKIMNYIENLSVKKGFAPSSEMFGKAGRFLASAPVGHVSDFTNARILLMPGSGMSLDDGSLYYPSELTKMPDESYVPKQAIDAVGRFHPDNKDKNPDVTHEARYKFYARNSPKNNPYSSEMEARILDGYEQGNIYAQKLPFADAPRPPAAVFTQDNSNYGSSFDDLVTSIAGE